MECVICCPNDSVYFHLWSLFGKDIGIPLYIVFTWNGCNLFFLLQLIPKSSSSVRCWNSFFTYKILPEVVSCYSCHLAIFSILCQLSFKVMIPTNSKQTFWFILTSSFTFFFPVRFMEKIKHAGSDFMLCSANLNWVY